MLRIALLLLASVSYVTYLTEGIKLLHVQKLQEDFLQTCDCECCRYSGEGLCSPIFYGNQYATSSANSNSASQCEPIIGAIASTAQCSMGKRTEKIDLNHKDVIGKISTPGEALATQINRIIDAEVVDKTRFCSLACEPAGGYRKPGSFLQRSLLRQKKQKFLKFLSQGGEACVPLQSSTIAQSGINSVFHPSFGNGLDPLKKAECENYKKQMYESITPVVDANNPQSDLQKAAVKDIEMCLSHHWEHTSIPHLKEMNGIGNANTNSNSLSIHCEFSNACEYTANLVSAMLPSFLENSACACDICHGVLSWSRYDNGKDCPRRNDVMSLCKSCVFPTAATGCTAYATSSMDTALEKFHKKSSGQVFAKEALETCINAHYDYPKLKAKAVTDGLDPAVAVTNPNTLMNNLCTVDTVCESILSTVEEMGKESVSNQRCQCESCMRFQGFLQNPENVCTDATIKEKALKSCQTCVVVDWGLPDPSTGAVATYEQTCSSFVNARFIQAAGKLNGVSTTEFKQCLAAGQDMTSDDNVGKGDNHGFSLEKLVPGMPAGDKGSFCTYDFVCKGAGYIVNTLGNLSASFAKNCACTLCNEIRKWTLNGAGSKCANAITLQKHCDLCIVAP